MRASRGFPLRFLCLAFLVLLLPIIGRAIVHAAERPNVVLIMADDLGYETIGANGGTSYATPTLDQMAAGGVRLEHCYVQPLCTPTRAQMMTGAYNVRNYIRFGYLDPKLKTFGNLFRDAGYATAIVGKWQLGSDPQLPNAFGFDEHCLWQHTRRPPRFANPGLEINGKEHDYSNGEYGPKLVNDYALDYIERHRDKPFFLYYPMILTHSPYQPTPDSKDWDPTAQGENVNQATKHFGDMVTYMDKMVGRLLTKLDGLKIRDNTLVIFVGDNGTGKGTRSLMEDKEVIGGKGSTTAAGMHVPCVVSWPTKIEKGKVLTDLVDSTDFLPTICAAAGIEPPAEMPLDGRSFLPQLQGERGTPREWIYCWYSPRQGADQKASEFAFDQNFKLYRDGRFYDLTADRGEKQELDVDSLTGAAAAAAVKFQQALAKFKDVRPAELDAVGKEKRKISPARKSRKSLSSKTSDP